ncbi:Anthocyanin 5-aromatic acyltransferase [Quillaja saponaria]|uniref:Anthocyanin 5-aromatic acyltransferase n=1 Tax=Quillaja saponaria TaxID=32244 RepID=A0AAD7LXA0_QUISA|nr:Anthocyanin 5-aromatic acyltransferase [Quillaja saponaria]WLD47572.1 ACT3 [Quillaja saponaria]
MAEALKLKVVDEFQVSPPQDSVPTTTLPLSFFDIPFLFISQGKRIFFYEFPHPTHHFMEAVLPHLKQSLSLTLKHFFPVAANIVFPPQPNKPHVLFDSGSSSVSFTVAESTADFNYLITDSPRAVSSVDPFVPKIPPARVLDDGTRLFPLLAIQATVIPNSGFSICIRFHHGIGDGMAFQHFVRSWAFQCKKLISTKPEEEEEGGKHSSLPIFNNGSTIPDPNGVELCFLNFLWKWTPALLKMADGSGSEFNSTHNSVNVDATFKVTQTHIDKLKQLISLKFYNGNESESEPVEKAPLRLSTFVVSCALIWVCLAKSEENTYIDDEEPYNFTFVADCRGRFEFSSVPATYFGNCVAPVYATLKRKEIVGENGIVEAAKAIRNKIKELEKNGVLKVAERWMLDAIEKTTTKHNVMVAGSPKLGVYEMDFGWGSPKKSDVLGNPGSILISLSESKDKNLGGIEVGVGLEKTQMNNFIQTFDQTLKIL